MRNRIVTLACAVLLTGTLAGCTREDPGCVAAGEALSDAAYRAQLKATVQRLFDAGELGEVHRRERPDTPPGLPGKYGVAVAPEFNALASKPLYQRTLFGARDHLIGVFVGWAAGKGVVVDLPNEDGVAPNETFVPMIDYGDGVLLVCSTQD